MMSIGCAPPLGLAAGMITGFGVYAFACWLAPLWNPFL